MSFTRRDTLLMAMGTAFAVAVPFKAFADVDADIKAFTGGAEMGSEGITLIAPEIAENGNTVPIEVDAPGAVSILVLATGNPTPAVGTFNLAHCLARKRHPHGFALRAHKTSLPLRRCQTAASCAPLKRLKSQSAAAAAKGI